MGRGTREKPARLAEKLAQIRTALGSSQDGMVRRLGAAHRISRNEISKYERGLREPPLAMILQYARAAGVSVEVLIDDELDLPKRLPSTPRHDYRVRR